MLKQLCVCDECKHVWLAPEVPERCAKCKSRAWNGTKSTSGEVYATVVEPVVGHNPTPGLIPVREVSREELQEEYPMGGSMAGFLTREAGIGMEIVMCAKHGQPLATCTGPSCRIERAERERRMG